MQDIINHIPAIKEYLSSGQVSDIQLNYNSQSRALIKLIYLH